MQLEVDIREGRGTATWRLPRHRVAADYRLSQGGAADGALLLVFARVDEGLDERAARLTPAWFTLNGVRAGDRLLVRLDESDCLCRRDAVLERVAPEP